MLIVQPPAMQTKIVARRHIVKYLSTHFDSWYEHVTNVVGLDIRPEELRFVSGTVKTTKWACSAWSGSYKNKQGSVKVVVPNNLQLGIIVQIAGEPLPSSFCNAGPVQQPLSPALSPITDGDEELPTRTLLGETRNQCIFMNYYSVKKRLFFKSYIEAAAGPHHLPPGGPEPKREETLVGQANADDHEGGAAKDPPALPVSCRACSILTRPRKSH